MSVAYVSHRCHSPGTWLALKFLLSANSTSRLAAVKRRNEHGSRDVGWASDTAAASAVTSATQFCEEPHGQGHGGMAHPDPYPPHEAHATCTCHMTGTQGRHTGPLTENLAVVLVVTVAKLVSADENTPAKAAGAAITPSNAEAGGLVASDWLRDSIHTAALSPQAAHRPETPLPPRGQPEVRPAPKELTARGRPGSS